MKDLLRITHVKDEICEIRVNIEDDGDSELLGATFLGILAKDNGDLKKAIIDAVFCYLCNEDEELAAVAERSMHEVQPTEGIQPALLIDDEILNELMSAKREADEKNNIAS